MRWLRAVRSWTTWPRTAIARGGGGPAGPVAASPGPLGGRPGPPRRRRAQARLPWFGPPMSLVSMVTARLMETWAHGQDIANALGAQRCPTSRLRRIAHLGLRARLRILRPRSEASGRAVPGRATSHQPAPAPPKELPTRTSRCRSGRSAVPLSTQAARSRRAGRPGPEHRCPRQPGTAVPDTGPQRTLAQVVTPAQQVVDLAEGPGSSALAAGESDLTAGDQRPARAVRGADRQRSEQGPGRRASAEYHWPRAVPGRGRRRSGWTGTPWHL